MQRFKRNQQYGRLYVLRLSVAPLCWTLFTLSSGVALMPYTFITLPSPVGKLKLVANGSRLAAILWENDKPNRVRLGPMSEAPGNPVLQNTARQLDEYFSGTRVRFDLELDFAGTPFQRQVWAALLTIPFGEPAPTARSPSKSATRLPYGPWARRTGAIQSPSSRHVIG